MCLGKTPQINVPPAPAAVAMPTPAPTPYVSPELAQGTQGGSANQVTRRKLRTDLSIPSGTGSSLVIPGQV